MVREAVLLGLAIASMCFVGGSVYWLSHKADGILSDFAGVLAPFVFVLTLWVCSALGRERAKRGTTYTLTNKRAFLGKLPIFGKRKLYQYPIAPESYVELKQGDPPSIEFSYPKRDLSGTLGPENPDRDGLLFAHVEDGLEVYRLILRARHETASKQVSTAITDS